MDINLQHWRYEDGEKFREYLMTFSKGEAKSAWEQRIVNTALPCIAVQSPDMKKIIKEIAKGNYLEYINLDMWDNFALVNIIGALICKIPDFKLMREYLIQYSSRIDNWGNADMLKFNVNENNKEDYYRLAEELSHNHLPFVRRVGITILFKLIEDSRYIDRIFDILCGFDNETEYYVNMVNAWLIAECFVKQRDKTIEFLDRCALNKFTVNKAISKCRDSYRISAVDKEMLLRYRIK